MTVTLSAVLREICENTLGRHSGSGRGGGDGAGGSTSSPVATSTPRIRASGEIKVGRDRDEDKDDVMAESAVKRRRALDEADGQVGSCHWTWL